MKISQTLRTAGKIDAAKAEKAAQKWRDVKKSLFGLDQSLESFISGLHTLQGALAGLDVEGKQKEFKELLESAINDLPLKQTQVKELIHSLCSYTHLDQAVKGLVPSFQKQEDLFDSLL
jgi:hypothetical protein